jgi:hypothetical protein
MTEEEIGYLQPFGINTVSGGPNQTQNLCVAYENKDKIIVLLVDRILELKKDYLKGFISLPSSTKTLAENNYCVKILRSWLSPQNRFMR